MMDGVNDAEHFREKLLRRKEEIMLSIDSLARGLREGQKDSIKEVSLYDNHPSDVGSETFEREKDLGRKRDLRYFLGEVDDALAKLERGDYGICEGCGRRIGRQRLEAVPEARFCSDCRPIPPGRETGRPIEEEILSPAFGRSFADDSEEEKVGYDGEDAWQEVARYGTAESPQDVGGAPSVSDSVIDFDERRGAVTPFDSIPLGSRRIMRPVRFRRYRSIRRDRH